MRLVPDQPLPPGATGERRFILNPSRSQPLDDNVLSWALEQVAAAGGRAAWLCASHAEAETVWDPLTATGH